MLLMSMALPPVRAIAKALHRLKGCGSVYFDDRVIVESGSEAQRSGLFFQQGTAVGFGEPYVNVVLYRGRSRRLGRVLHIFVARGHWQPQSSYQASESEWSLYHVGMEYGHWKTLI